MPGFIRNPPRGAGHCRLDAGTRQGAIRKLLGFHPEISAEPKSAGACAAKVMAPAPHAATGRIGAPPPARVRMTSPATMTTLVTLNAAPARNASV